MYKTIPPLNTNKSSLYIRVSDEKQVTEGYSLDAQLEICTKKAEELNKTVVSIYRDEGQTATVSERPEFLRMLDEAKDLNIDTIIVYNTDRFARNVTDHMIVKRRLSDMGIRLVSVTQPMLDESPEGKLVDTFLAGINQFYSEDLSRKTKRGLLGKWNQGWWPGYPLLGYMTTKPDGFKKIISPDPDISPIVKELFQLYSTNNYSLFTLRKYLAEKGIKTKNGKPLAHNTIHNILTNPFYYGFMRWNGLEKMGNHEPLIDKKTFDLCQLIASKHRNFVILKRKYDFLLRGVVVCANCGQRYVAEWHTINSSKMDKIAYYHCSKRIRCKSKYVETNNLEKQVATYFKQIKFSKGFTDAVTRRVERYLKDKDKETAVQRQTLLNRRNSLLGNRSTLEKRLMDETIDRDTFQRLHGEAQESINNIDKQLTKLETSRDFDFNLLEEVLALTRDIPKAYAKAPHLLKRRYLRFFFEKINVNNQKIETTTFSPLVQELISQKEVIFFSTKLRLIENTRNYYTSITCNF
jgi:DNA invertase Pin-like site-specific DNA recombinase